MLPPSPLQRLHHPAAAAAGVALYCKRDDLYRFAVGSPLQGNKIRKLAPYLPAAADLRGRTFVSFGGAYSNHLAALSAAGRRFGFATRFYVRGEAVSNPTLDYLRRSGSELHFISRTAYRRKTDPSFLSSLNLGEKDLLIPEGGSTPAALPHAGAVFSETVDALDRPPDVFCLSAGTGCTAAAIAIAAAPYPTSVEVFPALRGDWMREEIERWMPTGVSRERLRVVEDYAFGGYGKFPSSWQLTTPPGALAKRAEIGESGLPPLEPVYTAKLFAGVLDRLRKGQYSRGSTLVVYHSGGIY